MASRRVDHRVSAKQGGPTLKAEEASQRAARIAVDMAVMNTQYFITLDEFLPRQELYHLQMHLLYTLITTMGATVNVSPYTVLDFAKAYFQKLDRERKEYASNQQPPDR